MEVEKYIIFACGGRGTRMGADVPKQFLRLGGKTILQMSIERVLEADADVQVVLALPSQYMDYWMEECAAQGFEIRQRIVDGGITRFHSVKNALSKVPDGALVAVHDAVRPFASTELIRRLFSQAADCPAVIPVIPVTDTLKVLAANADGELEEVPGGKADRSVLFGAQTPQVFHSDILKKAYEQPYDTAFTDDASVVQAMGCRIKYIPGERYNIKLTTPEDMDFALKLMR